MAVLVTELVTVIGSVGIMEQRNEAIRLSSDGSPGYRPGFITDGSPGNGAGYRYWSVGITEQRNEAIRLGSDGSPGFITNGSPGY
jgi:hypothetical protein